MTNDDESPPDGKSSNDLSNGKEKNVVDDLEQEVLEVKKSTTKAKCLCGKRVRSAVWICCCICNQWFHCDCVSLGGLTKESVEGILKWECYQCFRPSFLAETDKTLADKQLIRKIVKEEFSAVVREELNVAFKGVCTKADVKTAMKTYADILKDENKEVIKATSGPAAIKEVCKTLNVEQIEREKKKKNVIVSNISEPPTNLNGEERKTHDMRYLCHELDMEKEEIVTCFRTGKIQMESDGSLKPRPVVVVFKKEETATLWHNDKKGTKTGSHWINADLCRADREAQFFARDERRKRRKQWEEKKKSETEKTETT